MKNIEVFNRIVAYVFKDLYEAFPKPILIRSGDIREKAAIADADWWEESRGFKGNVAGVSIIWLRDEGFIRYENVTNDWSQFGGVVLTNKGLAALNRTPDALKATPTIGDRLKELSTGATTEFVGGLAKIALSQVSN